MHVSAQPAHTVRGWKQYLDAGIYFFFILFVILLPYSMKGARYAWIAAFYLWLADLAISRKRMFAQPLALPMLAYVVFSGLSCVMSYDPYLSWPHMKLVCWTVLVATLFAQNLKRLSQVLVLLVLLLLSAGSVASFTAWQYWHGLGVRVMGTDANSPLYLAGIRPGDILVSINGHAVASEKDLSERIDAVSPQSVVRLNYLRGLPLRRYESYLRAHDFTANLRSPGLSLGVGRPQRAQGTLKHPMVLAELLLPIACLSWALMLGVSAHQHLPRIFFALIFLALTATVFATQTRAALSGLIIGCVIAILFLGSRRAKIWLVSLLVIVAVGGALWVRHTRGLNWIDPSDPGTRYRLLMWEDGLRLAEHHPFFGVGMETIQNHWTEWNLRGFAAYKQFWHFHSDWVQLAAERGLLTLAAWLWFVVAYIVYLVRLLPRIRERTRLGWAITVGILAGFVGYLFVSLVQYTLGDDPIVMFLFFGFGSAVAMERMLSERGAIDVA